MKWFGLLLGLGATLALLFLTSACSSNESQSVDPSLRPGNKAEGFPFERAFVACFEDNGIDAELFPDGSILADTRGTLSREEADALDELCTQRLEDEGFIVHEEPTDESRERNYNEYVTLRECLVEKGYAMPELPSFETFVGNRNAMTPFHEAILQRGVALVKDLNSCPYQSLVRASAVMPTE